ncbi:MAG: hypothetical protein AABW91_01980 [Nanoarchaeota archaeon]
MKKDVKKAQITIFIIIAVLIVSGIILIFTLNENARNMFTRTFSSETKYPQTVQSIKLNVQDCIDEALKTVVKENAVRGGYYFTLGDSVYYNPGNLSLARNIPFYFDKKYSVPTLAVLKDQISKGVSYELAGCINAEEYVDGPIEINNAKVDIDFSRYNAKVVMDDESVKIDIKFPVEITFQDVVYSVEDYSSSVKTSYFKMYGLANKITQTQTQYGNEICLTCNADLANEYSAQLLNEDYYEDDNNYVIIYNVLMLDPFNDKVEVWSFAHRLKR